MNAVCGVFRFDGGVSQQEMDRVTFKSPHWEADHQAIWVQGSIGFSSVQRFITPQCNQGKMPYTHVESGCVLVGDFFLTDRYSISACLNLSESCSDAELILLGYLKWGDDVSTHLCGRFMFAIWDPRIRRLFLTVDHLGARPCLFLYTPGKHFIFANTMDPFRQFCPNLLLNYTIISSFYTDSLSSEETCYQDVLRLRPAYSLSITAEGCVQKRYWKLALTPQKYSYCTQEEWMVAFRHLFERVVADYLRTPYLIMGHISGGLDSSSVVSMAAYHLKDKPIIGFTALPAYSDGPSFMPGFVHHELPIVESVVAAYPNIDLHVYRQGAPDYFERLLPVFWLIDQPLRNVQTYDWVLEAKQVALSRGCRIILNGSMGNSTISWPGKKNNSWIKRVIKSFLGLNKQDIYTHSFFLSGEKEAVLMSSIAPYDLWYGVESLDPTADQRLVEFCYHVPPEVYASGPAILSKRLLIREGLKEIVPESVRLNPNRGLQSSDWHLGFNAHRVSWLNEVQEMQMRCPEHPLFNLHDMHKIYRFFDPIESVNSLNVSDMGRVLFRFMSAFKFFKLLEDKKPTKAG